MSDNLILGIDIGGSGIKGAIVNIETGELVSERHRIETPQPSLPNSVAKVLKEMVDFFNWKGMIGCGFPAIVKKGVAMSAANIDKKWIGTDVKKVFEKATGCSVNIVNDADAAGMAEIQFGAGKNKDGVVMLLTIGTGIGSAVFVDGVLSPNTELGHLYLKGQEKVVEKYAAGSIRKKEKLKWDKWGERFNEYLVHLERLYSPDLFILGGGASKKFENYKDELKVDVKVKPAKMLNNAGIIGAAVYAYTISKNKMEKV